MCEPVVCFCFCLYDETEYPPIIRLTPASGLAFFMERRMSKKGKGKGKGGRGC